MAAREMRSELGYARCLVTMARRMLGGGLAERPEFVGLFSNNVLEERVMRLMETKTALSARAKLVRLASGATAMAAATLMATSFHVVPTMAAESEASSPVVQTAVLRTTVVGSADVPVVAPAVCVHRLAKPAVAPTAPVGAAPVVAPAAPVWGQHGATPSAVPVALAVPQSVPPMAPPSPVAPAPPAAPKAAPAAPATPAAPVAPKAVPTAPEVAPVAPAAPADEENAARHKENSYVYRMTDRDGNKVVIINENVRALTPDLTRHIIELQQEMVKLKIKDSFTSRDFREDMEKAQREIRQSALVNNAELQAKVQAMVKNFDKQNKYIGHCKDGVVKDKDKEKQKQPQSPQDQ
jgi:hypothetical protein